MESEMMAQEPSLENDEHDESKEIRNIRIQIASDIKRSNSAGLLGTLTRETNEQALLNNMITNYIMHLH